MIMNQTIRSKMYLIPLTIFLILGGVWIASSHRLKSDLAMVGQQGTPKLDCVSYTPFYPGESPHSFSDGLVIPQSRVRADLELLSQQFQCIRVYSMTGLDFLPGLAREFGLKILMGIWINGDEKGSLKELDLTAALAVENADVVRAVVVGNETLLRGEVSREKLASYIQLTKEKVGQIPVTYADVWEFWISNAQLAKSVDFITIHILPYWEDEPIAVSQAVLHVKQIRERVQKKFPEKTILLGETGWPSRGKPRWGAVPSLANQSEFMRGIIREASSSGWQYSLIEAFDQDWKAWQEGTVGGNWGINTASRMSKGVIDGAIPFFPDLRPVLLLTVAIAGIIYLFVFFFFKNVTWIAHVKMLVVAIPSGFVLGVAGVHAYFSISLSGDKTYLIWWFLLQVMALIVITRYLILGKRGTFVSTRASHLFEDQISWNQLLATLLLVGTVSFLLYETLSQVWLGRYRDYFGWGFILPIIALFLCRWEGDDFLWEKMMMGVALSFSIYMAVSEHFGNAEVLLWLGLIASFSGFVFVLPGSLFGILRPRIRLFVGVTALSLMTAALIRYGFLEYRPLNIQCLAEVKPSWCVCQSILGFLIHTGAFVLIGWTLLLIGLIKKRNLYLYAQILFCFGVVLYGVRGAAIGFLVASFLQWKDLRVRSPKHE